MVSGTMKVHTIIQMQNADNAAATLCTMLGYYGRYVPKEEVRPLCPGSRNGTPPAILVEAASAYCLDAESRETSLDELKAAPMPVVVLWKRRYYVVVKGFRRRLVEVSDPAKGEYEITEEKFANIYNGTIVTMKPGKDFKRGGKPEELRTMLNRRMEDMKGELKKLFVLNLAAVLLNVAFVEGVRRMLDEHTFDGTPWYAVWIAIAIESVLLLLFTSFAIRKTLLVNDASRRAAARSGSRMFKRLFRMPMEFFDQASAGELMQRFNNNATLDRSIMMTLIPRSIDVVMAIAYLVLMFSYNVYVAVVCLIVAHRLSTIRDADQILVMDAGRIVSRERMTS